MLAQAINLIYTIYACPCAWKIVPCAIRHGYGSRTNKLYWMAPIHFSCLRFFCAHEHGPRIYGHKSRANGWPALINPCASYWPCYHSKQFRDADPILFQFGASVVDGGPTLNGHVCYDSRRVCCSRALHTECPLCLNTMYAGIVVSRDKTMLYHQNIVSFPFRTLFCCLADI